MKGLNVDVTFTVTITAECATEVLDELAVYYWCTAIKPMGKMKGETIGEHLVNGGQVYIYEEDGKFHQLTAAKFAKGIQRWLHEIPEYFNEILKSDGANTFVDLTALTEEDKDVIIQCAIFGKMVH